MEKVKEENSLAVINDSIFKKIKNFFVGLFTRRSDYFEEGEIDYNSDEVVEELKNEKPKLFNFDNPDNYYYAEDNISEENENMSVNVEDDICENSQGESENNCYGKNNSTNGYANSITSTNVNDKENEEKYMNNKKSKACEEKEEIEQKLMNYYASITRNMNGKQAE